MKRITLLLVGLVISFSAFSQTQRSTELFNEDFSSGVPPTGWTIEGMEAQWSQSPSTNAGGSAPEAKLHYTNGNGESRLISPETDLTGVSTVIFSFKQFLDDYSGEGYTIGVSTRSGGGAWTDVWATNPIGNIGPETKDLIITGGDVGASDFQICIFLSGNFFNFDDWFIDDLVMSEPDSNDVAMESIETPFYTEIGDLDIKGTFKNVGLSNVTSVDVNYQIDSDAIVTETVGGINLVTTDAYSHTFSTPWATTVGDHTLKIWISNVNGSGDDDDTSNDEKSQTVSIASQSTQNMPMYEIFTSSTCGPCAPFNTNTFNPFMADHPDDITVIKYQMSWPAPGDPYYTEEGGVRRGFYGVNGIPFPLAGGAPTGNVVASFDTESARPSYFEMSSTLDIDGDNAIATINIMPYLTVDMRVHIAIVEKTTFDNTGNNGETQFENVMMKMLPDASGTVVSFSLGIESVIVESFDMSSTNVEEMDDLQVVAFIQDDSDKVILQSTFANGETLGLDTNALQHVSFYPNPSKGNLYISTDRELQVAIYDILGKMVYSKKGVNNETLNLTHLNSGMYLVNMNDGENQVTKKLIINK